MRNRHRKAFPELNSKIDERMEIPVYSCVRSLDRTEMNINIKASRAWPWEWRRHDVFTRKNGGKG